MRPVLRSLLARLRRIPAPLAVLLAVGAVLSLSWNLAVAPLQGFDEADHAAYVAHLAETGSPPEVNGGSRSYPPAEDTALGPLGYLRILGNRDARPPWSESAIRSYERVEDGLPPGSNGTGDGPNPLAKNPPLYYALESIGWKITIGGNFFTRLFVLRLGSGIMFLAAIAFAWLAAGELFRRMVPRVVLTGVVALHPMTSYEGAIVNADILQLTGWCAFLWLALRAARLGPSPWRLAAVALAAAAIILTHGRGVAVVPAFLVAVAVVLLKHRPPLKQLLLGGGVAVAIVAVTFGIYRIWLGAAGGGSLYGGEVNLGPAGSFSIRQLFSFVWQFYLSPLASMAPRVGPDYGYRQVWVETLWSSFGAYEITAPPWVFSCIQVGLVLLGAAVLALVVKRFSWFVARWPQVLILGAIFVSVLGLLHVASYRAIVGGSDDPLITGRYLLPVLPVIGAGAAGVVAALPRRVGPLVAVVLLVALASLTVASVGLTVARFYV